MDRPAAGPGGPLPLRFGDQVVLAVPLLCALVLLVVYWARTSHWGSQAVDWDDRSGRELEYRIDLNSATWVEWSQLPGIGQVLARRIVEDRARNGPFRSVDDLDRVRGMGPQKIAAVRPFIRTGTEGAAPPAGIPASAAGADQP